MTRFILSRPQISISPHILQHQLCIKIPHLPFWALAAVAKAPRRSSSCVAGDSDYSCVHTKSGVINSATFPLVTVRLWPLQVKLLTERLFEGVKVGLLFAVFKYCVRSPELSLFTSTAIKCLCLYYLFFLVIWGECNMFTLVVLDVSWHINAHNSVRIE